MNCKHCKKEIRAGRYCCRCSRYLRNHPEGWYTDAPVYGQVRHASNGDPICDICGEAHRKLGNHLAFYHHVDIKEYKQSRGLCFNESLTNPDYVKTMKGYVDVNYNKVVKKNLIKKGRTTRFKKGHVIEGQGKHKLRADFFSLLSKRDIKTLNSFANKYGNKKEFRTMWSQYRHHVLNKIHPTKPKDYFKKFEEDTNE